MRSPPCPGLWLDTHVNTLVVSSRWRSQRGYGGWWSSVPPWNKKKWNEDLTQMAYFVTHLLAAPTEWAHVFLTCRARWSIRSCSGSKLQTVCCSWSSTAGSSELSSSVSVRGPGWDLPSGRGWTGPRDLHTPGKHTHTKCRCTQWKPAV